jgi:hypothetical protein
LVVQLAAPLEPGVTYAAKVQRVTNLTGILEGGGEAEVVRPLPRDTASARDTTFVPDTAAVRDTIPPPDTVPPPDTIPPDTGRVLPPGRRR